MEPQAATAYLELWEHYKLNGERFKPKAEDKSQPALNPQKKFFAASNVIYAPVDAWSTEADNFKGFDGAEIAVIALEGPLMKGDYCGYYGTASLLSFFKLADRTPSVKTIVLLVDSPGGSVDGTATFANAIKASQKHTVTIIENMMGSAAYWIGSSTDEVIATSNTDMIGCIGTMVSWMDRTQYLEQNGIVLREYYATRSTEKNKAFNEANKGNGKLLIQSMLDPTNNEFLDAVTENRNGKIDLKTEDVLSGKVYLAKDSLKFGLIDAIMPLDEAMQYALETGQQKQKNTNSKTLNMKWTKILALLGLAGTVASSAEIKLEDTHVDNLEALITERDALIAERNSLQSAATTHAEDMQALGSQLAATNDQLVIANGVAETATAQLATANTELATAQTNIATLTAENERLGKLDGSRFNNPDNEQDTDPVPDSEVKAEEMAFQKELNEKV